MPSKPSLSKPPRRRRSAEAARNHILKCAAELLRTEGLDGLKLNAIAEAAQVAHSNILHHFGSIEQLKLSLADFLARRLLLDLVPMLANHGFSSPPDYAGAKALFSLFAEKHYGRLLAWAILSGHQPSPKKLKSFFRLLTMLLSVRLRNFDVPKNEASLLARRAIRLLVTAAIGEGVIGGLLEEVHPTGDSSVEAGAWITQLMMSTLPKKDLI